VVDFVFDFIFAAWLISPNRYVYIYINTYIYLFVSRKKRAKIAENSPGNFAAALFFSVFLFALSKSQVLECENQK